MGPETYLTAKNVVENTGVIELASEPEKPQLTRKQIGELRRRYITVVHGTVRACDHKFNSKSQPKLNCDYCWDAYFMTAVDTAAIHDDLMKGGKKQLVNVYGTKFTKQFGRFLTEQMQAEESDGQTDSMVPSGDRPETSDSNESPYELGTAE